MRITTFITISFASATVGAEYIVSDVTRRVVSQPGSSMRRAQRLARRRLASVETFLPQVDHEEYLINFTIGTPPQSMAAILDTGSTDLFVPSTAHPKCQAGECVAGAYDGAQSTTYNVLIKDGFKTQFVDPADTDSGDWVDETIIIGGSRIITKSIMAVSNAGFDAVGVFGLGYAQNEAIPNPNGNATYPTVLDNMVSQGLLNRPAYSLHLDSVDQSGGSICFGCIDESKFTGRLTALPLQQGTSPKVPEFYITLSSIVLTDATGKETTITPEGFAQSALLDSGTSITGLPNEVFEPMARGLGAVAIDLSDNDDGSEIVYIVPCELKGTNATLTYTFGGTDKSASKVVVPLSQVIGNTGQWFNASEFASPEGGCDMGMTGPIGGVAILGDTFMRSAYVVFDLANSVIALAQAKVGTGYGGNTSEEDCASIKEIPAGRGLPGVNITAAAPGKQIPAALADAMSDVPAATVGPDGRIVPGMPSFDLLACGSNVTAQ
ncbi:hypothetical protein Daus18300_012564 [Diaporthe australafricana]|uniref:Peptidase A1 domain-containing protein n=1 Tax=Diaporthe australafricana TaxID=127596 RepID=A0ABR3W2C5_9PEZI